MARKTRPTALGLMSISVWCKACFSAVSLARIALMDILMPSITGPSSFISVQMAAIPMVPAPIKRTFWAHTALAKAAAVWPSAGDNVEVK